MKTTIKSITEDEAVEMFRKGRRVIMGEYRMGKAETINYLDKITRKPASFQAIKHTVEIGDDSFHVSERVPDGFVVESFSPPMEKGTRCLLQFEGFKILNGAGQWSGTVTPIVPKAAAPGK